MYDNLPTTDFEKGFTLVELLVTISIVAMVGVVASSTLFSLFRGASKSEILKEVKQNGETALSVMEQKVRNATSVLCTSLGGSQYFMTITNQDGTTTQFACNSSPLTLTQDNKNLINSASTGTSIQLVACDASVFVCTPPVNPTSVQIRFGLKEGNANANTAETATSYFQSTVTLRNQ